MMGIHNRGDWDLTRHQQYSGKKLTYRDPVSNKEYLPWDIETSMGIERPLLFLLLDAYHEENDRVILKLDPRLAPYKMAVFPLLANKPELVDMARKIHHNVQNDYMTAWDERGNIGKRYAAQDEVGTPFCVTVDFQSLEDQTVTIRHRDSGKQERIPASSITSYLLPILHK
jgi:glycyl-tRNA synthetase